MTLNIVQYLFGFGNASFKIQSYAWRNKFFLCVFNQPAY